MFDLTKSFALVLALGLVTSASAQETTTPVVPPADAPAAEAPAAEPAPVVGDGVAKTADGLTMGQVEGEAADGVGSTYTQEVFGDWELRCVRTAEGDDPCQLYQLLKDADGNSVAEISMFALPAGQQAMAGATIITPLETLLTEDIRITVDTGKAKRYPFTWCSSIGCVARVGFTAEEVAALKAGNKATMTIVPVGAPDQTVALNVSLKGFTAGYDAVAKFVVK